MEYLSFSRLAALETCGLRFFYEYVARLAPEDPVPTHHASFGTLLHGLYERHAASGGAEGFEELRGAYDEGFRAIAPEFPSREEAVVFYRQGLGGLFRFSRYRVDDVVGSEMAFEHAIERGVPPVKGFIDRVIHTDEHGYIVADLKTGKPFSGRHRTKMRQLVLYSLACGELYGETAASGYFDFAVRGQREWVDIGDEDRAAARSWVREKWEQILREDFAPRYSRPFCSVYCAYRSRCPAFLEHANDSRQADGR